MSNNLKWRRNEWSNEQGRCALLWAQLFHSPVLRFIEIHYATYDVFFLGLSRFDSPHLRQLCWQSSRYSPSSLPTISEARWQSSLCSMQPASLHSCDIRSQHLCVSSRVKAPRFVLTIKHNSLAKTQVRTYLNLLRAFFLSCFLLSSNWFFSTPRVWFPNLTIYVFRSLNNYV